MAEKPVETELSRDLTLFQITMMGLGMMIGAGVFLGIGNSIFVAGPGGALLTFSLNGIIAMFTALSYAELSSAVPRAGGAYNYARIGFGQGPSFIAGWMEWFASSVAGSLYAVTFAIYVVRYLEVLHLMIWWPFSISIAEKVLAVCVAVFFFSINYRGAAETGKIGAIMTLGQTLFLLVIGAIGMVVVIKDPSRFQNFDPFLPHGWSKLLITMGFTYVAFEGYEVIAQAGDEAIDPRKNLPKAIIFCIFIATITYVSVVFAAVVAVKAGSPGVTGAPWEWIGQFRERGFGEAVARLIPMGNFLLTLAVIFASTSALNATIYSATRALYALGRDQMVPTFFARISLKRKTPWTALATVGILVLTVIIFLPVIDVASSASMMFLLLFFLVNICVIKVRWHMGDELKYGYLMPLFPVFPIIAIICQAVLAVWLVHMSLIAWIVVPVWIFGGFGIYRYYSKFHYKPTEHDIIVLEEDEIVEADKYQVMVAVANPENSIKMVRTTRKLCRAKNASIKLINMVRLPDITPLPNLDGHLLPGREAILEAMLYLEPFFPVTTTISHCHNVARGILSTVRQKRINLLIMGWHGKPRSSGFRFGSTIDPIIERCPCDVVILKETGNGLFNRILVPIAGGPNSSFAVEIAGILCEDEGIICALSVITDSEKFSVENFIDSQYPVSGLNGENIITKTVHNADVVSAIIEEAKNYDLIVMGCTRKPSIYQIAKESIPEKIARLSSKPFIMVNKAQGVKSLIKRWI